MVEYSESRFRPHRTGCPFSHNPKHGWNSMKRQPLYKLMYVQILAAIAAGVLLGHFFPETAVKMKPFGDAFIKLIKMLIAPIIFCTVVVGLAGMDDIKKVGKTGGLALLYFEAVSTFALIFGLLIVNLLRPGVGMNVDPAEIDTQAVAAYASSDVAGKMHSATDYLLNVIPGSVVDAFATGNILQVLFFSLLFGLALNMAGGKGTMIFDIIEKTERLLFSIICLIVKLAPIGAFGAIAFTIGKYGLDSLVALGKLIFIFWASCLVFVFLVLGSIARLHGFSLWKFMRYIKEELLIVLGTCSSESVLPRMMTKLEELGVKKSVVGLVIPAGYSFNMDGTSIYLTMAAIFIAQSTNTNLSLWQQITLLAVLMLTSKGAAGVAGSGFVVLAATLSAIDVIPVAGLALIVGVDRFMSEARSLTNLIGNGVATLVVAKWTGELNMDQLQERLNSTPYR